MAKKLLFIVNPKAGKQKAANALSAIVSKFCAEGWLPTVVMTEYPGHAAALAAEYGKDFERVVCAGGDGTLNETVTGLMQAGIDRPVGYLPCGTTNDLGETLGLPLDLSEAADVAVNGTPRSLDLGDMNGRHFVYTASFGAFTRASYDTPQSVKNVLGHFAYILEGSREVFDLKPTHLRMETDAGVFEGDYLFGSITNSTSLAGIISIDKDMVKLDDGKFELLLADMPVNAMEFGRLLLNVSQKKFGEMLHLYTISRLSMDTDEDIDWTLDGEKAEAGRHTEIKNLCRAMNIIVPAVNQEETV